MEKVVRAKGDGDVLRLSTTPGDFIARGKQIGIVILAGDRGVEAEFRRIIPSDVSLYTTRTESYVGLETTVASNAIRRAASMLVPGLQLDAIGYACSSGSFLVGEKLLVEALTSNRGLARAVTVKRAVLEAAAGHGVRTISLLTPYDAELTKLIISDLRVSGLCTVRAGCLGLETDDEIAGLSPSRIFESALSLDCRDSEALVILCNALQTWSVVPDLMRATGKPVIGSSQALIASCLRD